jgi:hypothetical protein
MKKLLPFILLVAACTPQSSAPVADEVKTKEVFDHHMKTFQANDLEGVMADYTEASILITPDRTYKGLAEIRENFVNAFGVLPTNGTTFNITYSTVSGDVAYVVWTAMTPTLNFKYATDTFIVQDGKIVSQTYAGDVVEVEAGDSGD